MGCSFLSSSGRVLGRESPMIGSGSVFSHGNSRDRYWLTSCNAMVAPPLTASRGTLDELCACVALRTEVLITRFAHRAVRRAGRHSIDQRDVAEADVPAALDVPERGSGRREIACFVEGCDCDCGS